jgi:Ca2+-binding RTX toxin-like protein
VAFNGNVFFDGLDGADILQAGRGNDEIHGGPGNDFIYGVTGDDLLFGDEGDDYLQGANGDDGIDGGAGNVRLVGILQLAVSGPVADGDDDHDDG